MSLKSSMRTGKTRGAGISVLTLILLLVSLAVFPGAAYAKTKDASVGYASLAHSPTGNVHLSYNATTKTLTVTTTLIGLAPSSIHPAHIHEGNCQNPNDPVKYSLQNVVSDMTGQAKTTTIIKNVPDGIPASGWLINVHNGPKLQPEDQYTPIACATILNTDAANEVSAPLGPTTSPNENAIGNSKLSVEGKVLTVTLNVSGLAPNSTHAAHIHAGDCNYTKQILYDLSPLQADSQGNATKTMSFNGVAGIPATGWDINIHYTTDLSTQTGFNPILCGNITTS
ncbi:hypothetical protein KDA_60230 [Dictyobacter alpinus]|uniref:CHRD domain-containing protein n=1 Tax=Dictyobacter alpinus TaxID=2014873 RepID=A0A402BGT0_9CHLR|nr:CHRD domain-containing protein [Dictyobacter alpinus]GCE30539.1 hypothetical protein KDA_60230 [Dictyobacter alpinus]